MAKLKDYCLHITDGEHGTVENDSVGEYFLLSNKNIVNGDILVSDNYRRISSATFYNINKRTKLEEGDVIISTVGTIGKIAIVKSKPNYDFQRSVGIIKCDLKKIYNRFLYYFFNLSYIQKQLINISKGAVQKCIFINDLKNFEINNMPDITKQIKISKILSVLDEKIELNNKINKELEKFAKDLYDYWFVQFDFPDENKRPLLFRIFSWLKPVLKGAIYV